MGVTRRQLLRCLAAAAPAARGQGQAPRIVSPVDGAILNRHDGTATASGLEIEVNGECAEGASVHVNGRPAETAGGRFRARLALNRQTNRIAAAAGGRKHSIEVLWDRHSFPRYRVSTDDNIWFLRDLARNAARYSSIFDNAYMAFWREMHRKYDAKVHFNIYYETEGFNLTQMPAKYRDEWRKNRDWTRLTFHARANDPARPYKDAPAEQVVQDYRLVTREIERFAGKEMLSPATTIHWGEATRDAVIALRREGIRILAGYFTFRDGQPTVSYHLDPERTRYLTGRDYWKDTETGVIFVRHDIVINSYPVDKIVAHLESVAADPHQAEVMELMIHEQYFYPDYSAYEPDYRERVERAIGWASGKGYKPVFYGDGFLGA
jgi:hypothetical protein